MRWDPENGKYHHTQHTDRQHQEHGVIGRVSSQGQAEGQIDVRVRPAAGIRLRVTHCRVVKDMPLHVGRVFVERDVPLVRYERL